MRSGDAGVFAPCSLREMIDDYQRTLIAHALALSGGNVTAAAQLLRTERPNLCRRMRRLQMPLRRRRVSQETQSDQAVSELPDSAASRTEEQNGQGD